MLKGFTKRISDDRAYTLVEVLLASTLFLVFLGAISGLFVHAVKSYKFGEKKIKVIANARLAMDRISQDLKNASFILYPDESTLKTAGSDLIIYSAVEFRDSPYGPTNVFGYRLDREANRIQKMMYNTDFDVENPSTGLLLEDRFISDNISALTFSQGDPGNPQLITIRLRTTVQDKDQVFLMTRVFIRH